MQERNQAMHAKNLRAAMELAVRRDELIERSVVLRQASFLLVALRQKLLAIPTRVSRRCVGKDFDEIHQILSEEITRALQEIRDLRKAGIDPDWEQEQEDFSRRSRG